MANLTLLIGIGIFLFTCVYMFFKLSDQQLRAKLTDQEAPNHFILQLMILFFILSAVVLVGKVSLNSNDDCSFEVINSTIVGNTTTYAHDYVCVSNPSTTALTFYKSTLWFMSLILSYIFIYFIYEVLKFEGWVVPKK